MRIKIRNWGPLKEVDYDLSKNLIVTYGDNNIGKSYAMQVIYLLLKHLISYAKRSVQVSRSLYYFDYEDDPQKPLTPIEMLVVAFSREESRDVLDISEELIEIYTELLERAIYPRLVNSFQNTFGTYSQILFEKPEIRLEVSESIHCIFDLEHEKLTLRMKRKPTRLRKTISEFHKSRNGKEQLDIYVCQNHVSTPANLIEEEILKIQREFGLEIAKQVKAVYFLPASRSGIYTGMSSFGPILAQLSQNRAYIRGPIQIPSISEPISDYYMQLSDIRSDTRRSFSEWAEKIEANVLKGNVIYDKKSKSIVYQPFGSNLRMEMGDTSSMVSEISPITAFLKYIVNTDMPYWLRRQIGDAEKPKVVLFIEEPEAHLHPQNQIALIKIFAELSKQNAIMIMASHSNYIFNQLNNLVLEQKLDKESYSPIIMQKKRNKSRSSYMHIDELGVDDENFADVSEQLFMEREEILCKLSQEMGEQ
ncbi:MAG: AAA family ATPase [Lachnospiraceae bacterium]|nr:AAA family ATPase [Lachnospiraceae bacterium]